jgi:hypothetical protein
MFKTFLWTVLILALALLFTLHHQNTDVSNVSNPAYRDGAYLGKLAAERGETPRFSFGRWAATSARQSFVEGYAAAYNQQLADDAQQGGNLNTQAAFRDGLYLGTLAAQENRTPHLMNGRWVRHADQSYFELGYRQSYIQTASRSLQQTRAISEARLIQ